MSPEDMPQSLSRGHVVCPRDCGETFPIVAALWLEPGEPGDRELLVKFELVESPVPAVEQHIREAHLDGDPGYVA